MPKTDYVIEVKGLKKSYGSTKVLKGVDFKVQRGTMLALLGPNGAGKTTTVRILSTLLNFDDGTAAVEGYDIASEPAKVQGVIGGATFLEMYDAFRLGKKIFLYNDIPDSILKDEIEGFLPLVTHGDMSLIK